MKQTYFFLLFLSLIACSTVDPATTSEALNSTATLMPINFKISIESLRIDSKYLTNTPRKVDIFLPPGYQNSEQHYPVIYAQDGQDMSAVHLKETLESLYLQKAIKPVIVVAVHASGERLSEYGVAGVPDYQFRGNRADAYTSMLLEEIMPEINQKYRTLTEPENTAIFGWSLGGLMAFDLAWNHPNVFGHVGAFSGSFWWHTENEDLQSVLNSRITHNMLRQSNKRVGMQFWFETGLLDEEDDRDADGVIDMVQDTRELINELKKLGYTDEDIRLLELPTGRHNPSTWAEALPDFLIWAFPLK